MEKTTAFMGAIIALTVLASFFLFYEEIEQVVEEKIVNRVPKIALESAKNECLEYTEIAGSLITGRVPFGICSRNRPSYCDNGKLLAKCQVCGCSSDESCNSNGECVYGFGGEGGAPEAPGEEDVQEDPGPQIPVEGSCSDSDISNSPSPVFSSGGCTDDLGSYSDSCTDPGNGQPSTVWVKEYRCTTIDNVRTCIADYRSCSSSADNYYGSTNSTCGGSSCSVPVIEICSDGIMNQDETGVDCGGVCTACVVETCSDGIMNQDETGVDCGGPCSSCGGGGGGTSETCTILNYDEKGQTIFTNSECQDNFGTYQNSCRSPIGGGLSTIFIKTYSCVNNKCSQTYLSCEVAAQQFYGTNNYQCLNGVCIPKT